MKPETAMKPPTPAQCNEAAKTLRRAAAASARVEDDPGRTAVLTWAAEIMEAKAFVGMLADVVGLRRKLR